MQRYYSKEDYMTLKANGSWQFPERIELCEVPFYSEKLKEYPFNSNLYFDLKNTYSIHASFIGFLINAKSKAEKQGCDLVLDLSEEVHRLFKLLKVHDYFLGTKQKKQKTA
jgi:hypothetical protein